MIGLFAHFPFFASLRTGAHDSTPVAKGAGAAGLFPTGGAVHCESLLSPPASQPGDEIYGDVVAVPVVHGPVDYVVPATFATGKARGITA